jgi:hypothetical protein
MPLILILIILLLIFGGGGAYMGPGLGYYGGGGISVILLIVILYLFFNGRRTRLWKAPFLSAERRSRHYVEPGQLACNALLDTGHANQPRAEPVSVEDWAKWLQAIHGQPVSFIDHDQGRGIRDCLTLVSYSSNSKKYVGVSGGNCEAL